MQSLPLSRAETHPKPIRNEIIHIPSDSAPILLWFDDHLVNGQTNQFPTVLVNGTDLNVIKTSVLGSYDDGTIAFQGPESGILVDGAVYAVFENNRELTRVDIKEVKKKFVLAKPIKGMRGIASPAKGAKRLVILKPIGQLASDYAPLRMNYLDIDVKVMANLAVTTLTMNFHNDLDRVLEGKLQFPLGEGQTVSRFAMTVNGKLREGVVVEKAKGRQVFEDIVRRGIDPGLLELTKGNVFKARVYPILAKGDKKIVVAYEQELQDFGNGYLYNLPLDFPGRVDHFSINVEVANQQDPPLVVMSELETL